MRIHQIASARSRQAYRHRVDRKVTTGQIVEQGCRRDHRKRAWGRVALPAGGDEVDMPLAVRELDDGGTKPPVGHHGRADPRGNPLRQRNRVALDDQVDVVQVNAPEQGITHDAADDADLPLEVRQEPRDHRMGPKALVEVGTIRHVSWDPLSEKLVENSPLRTPELVTAFSRYEQLTITELDGAWDQVNAAFREWVEQPQNAGRPIREAPQYWDRIAIDSLRERRTWWE